MRALTGSHIRRKRIEMGLTQAALARQAGISASYLNLIEKNKRDIAGSLLLRIAAQLRLDVDELTGTRAERQLHRLREILGDPLLQGLALDQTDLRELIAGFPEIVQVVIALHRGYSDAGAEIEAYANRFHSDPMLAEMLHEVLNRIAGIRSSAEIVSGVEGLAEADRDRFIAAITHEAREVTGSINGLVRYFDSSSLQRRSISPMREVEDAFITAGNHFPELEEAAQTLRGAVAGEFGEPALSAHLHGEYGVTCRVWPEGGGSDGPGPAEQVWMDGRAGTLWLRGSARYATRQFRLCRQIAELGATEVLARTCEGLALRSDEARGIALTALASYVAGAMIMPYRAFRDNAEAHRYDIDLLSHHYRASFEQVAHRLITLRRRNDEGLPFGFLRADPSGRLTKRFPLPGLTLPGGGHGCLLWPIYGAAGAPGILRQVAEFPNGSRFLLIAKSVSKRVASWQERPLAFSIMLACDIHHADRTVYAHGLDLADSRISVPVGPSCLLCPRENCGHRQEETSLARG
ncbi:short-chain fatty acyl-CoA regulator family protein [uncultured Paracoccus sp.]|uniref:helix-turn-helix domain-containing protein n=1 Tax=uncultured Paracoccus sp. TaxID=189685 RepID=UPI0025DBC02E|nr:short-chain fatty acyl-CoA regulator family protein [uncultured Paracoccus sp.]